MGQVSLFLVVPALAVTALLSCKKSDIAADVPSCIRQQIKAEINNPNSYIGAVNEYLFQNRIVYGFDQGLIADGQLIIKDGYCNELCRVGGFGGPAVYMCNGENFFQAAVFNRNIWTRK